MPPIGLAAYRDALRVPTSGGIHNGGRRKLARAGYRVMVDGVRELLWGPCPVAQLPMQPRNLVQRPLGRRVACPRLTIDPRFHLRQRGRQLARQLGEADMHFGFEGGESCLGALHALLRGVGHGQRHVRQAFRLLPELANRLLLHLLERVPLALDRGFQLLQPIGGLLPDAGTGVLPLAGVGLKL